jgi:signal transduction histidine kinase
MKFGDAFELQNASWPVLMVESKGKITRANKAALGIFGEKIGKFDEAGLSAIWAPTNTQTLEQFLQSGDNGMATIIGVKLVTLDGSSTSWMASVSRASDGNESFLIQLFADNHTANSEGKAGAADAAEAHKQKLDCALQLARSVSNEFNNALTSVLGHTSLVLGKMEPDHPWRRSLLEVEKSAGKAAEISNDLASFSRREKDSDAKLQGNVNAVLQRCVEFFKHNPGEQSIAWPMQLERNPFACKFDDLKMQQAFLRVLENSVQALPGQGRIGLQSRNVELNEATQDRNVKLAPGAYVCVEIADNGRGIEPDILPKIFEPFFTTKRDKKHRGLGLAWVYGIVTNLGGGVAVSSQPGAGTSVRIYLPAEKRILQEAPQFSKEDLRGTQSVLLVDDEELVLTMAKTILAEHGYTVEAASSGKQALELISRRAQPFDLVITDLVMPAMSGRELVEKIQEITPATKIICTSGYPWPAPQIRNLTFLKKPFKAQDLLSRIKQALS